jgi:hypothetical protein
MLTADAEHSPTIIAARSSNSRTRIIAVALWYMHVCGMTSQAVIFKKAGEDGLIAPPTGDECAIPDMKVLSVCDSELEFRAKKTVTGIDPPSIEKQFCVNAGTLENRPHVTQAEPWFTLVIRSGQGIKEILADVLKKVAEYKKEEAVAFLAGDPKKFRAIQVGWQLNEREERKLNMTLYPHQNRWSGISKSFAK